MKVNTAKSTRTSPLSRIIMKVVRELSEVDASILSSPMMCMPTAKLVKPIPGHGWTRILVAFDCVVVQSLN